MNKNSEFYFLVGINDIPWNRIVHWYGRSTNFPKLFTDLLSEDLAIQQSSINEIKNKIEHQGGVLMATPFTLIFLFRILTLNRTRIEGILNDILDTILVTLEAAKFQINFYTDNPVNMNIKSIKELLSEKYLWSEFESQRQDEINWEESNYDEERYFWVYFTIDIAKSLMPIIVPFRTNKFYIEKAKKILAIADLSKNYL